jgi:1,4-alpha-glucan branching enzyme
MLQLIKRYKTLNADFPRELWDDEWHKTIAFERSNLVFVFNWHLTLSPFQFEFIVPKEGEYKLILNSDDTAFGGFGRIDPEVRYHTKLDADGFPRIAIYNVNRTAMVFVHIDDEIPVPEAEILKAESQPTVQAPTKAKKTTSKPKATKKAKE